jgi:hypothetical protein
LDMVGGVECEEKWSIGNTWNKTEECKVDVYVL